MRSRKHQIIQIAASLFKERGYSAVSMRDLAQAVDLQAASLYNHISGKQDILSEIILDPARRFTAGMVKVVDSGESAFAKAEQLITLHIDLALSHSNELAVMNNDWMHLEGDSYAEYIKRRKEYERDFRLILSQGVVDGTFHDLNVDTLLFAILSTLRTLYLYLPKKNAEEIARFRMDLPKILLQGLVKN
jgi:AcrR family transcriptional regulator